MSKGSSGRIVIEIDPSLKRKLYQALAGDASTLKDWFISTASLYIAEREQPAFPELVPRNIKRIPNQ